MRHKQGDHTPFRNNDRFEELIDFVLAVTLFPKFSYYVKTFIRFVGLVLTSLANEQLDWKVTPGKVKFTCCAILQIG